MVQQVEEGCERRKTRQSIGEWERECLKEQCCPEPQADDAHIFDTAKGQQSFQVGFHQGIEHPEHCRNEANTQQQGTPPERRNDSLEGKRGGWISVGLQTNTAKQI